MDRMLANQYFMSQRFAEAIPHFEETLRHQPQDRRVMKHLVICYVMTGKLDLALQKLKLLLENSSTLQNDLFHEDGPCPCRDVLAEWHETPPARFSHLEYLLAAGILTLFCEGQIGVTYFKTAQLLAQNDNTIDELMEIFAQRFPEDTQFLLE